MRLLKATGAAFAALTIATMFAAPASAVDNGYEWEIGKKSSSPGIDEPCVSDDYVSGCYRESDDTWWVKDKAGDGRSAVITWENSAGGKARAGTCRNKSGTGTWAKCDHNFTEGSELRFGICRYDATSGTWKGNTSAYLKHLDCSSRSGQAIA